MSSTTVDPALALASELEARGLERPRLALVLGSGLGAFVDEITDETVIPGAELEHLPESAVPGHAGRLVFGHVEGVPVAVQEGRVHLYEGWSVAEVTRAVRAFAHLGAEGLLLTNAAGSLRRDWPPGTLMRVTDHMNLQGRALLRGLGPASGCPYDVGFGAAIDRAAGAAGMELQRGVYVGIMGPTYESPTEVEMYAWMGADAIGMSTVAEAAVGRALGMRVAAISCIANNAVLASAITHEEVITAVRAASGGFVQLLTSAVREIAKELW